MLSLVIPKMYFQDLVLEVAEGQFRNASLVRCRSPAFLVLTCVLCCLLLVIALRAQRQERRAL
jgi:hypothetical protein